MSDDIRKQVAEYIEKNCPKGYARLFVPPTWDVRESRCRSCGLTKERAEEGTRWCITTIMRVDDANRLARFSFAMVCGACMVDQARMQALADRVFGVELLH